MTEVQPMKMAAAEALYDDRGARARSRLHHRHARRQPGGFAIKIPDLLSFLATGTPDAEVEGIDDLRGAIRAEVRHDPGAGTTPPATTRRSSR